MIQVRLYLIQFHANCRVRKVYILNWTLSCVILLVKLCINVGNNEYITLCNFGDRINKEKKLGLKRIKIEAIYVTRKRQS